MIMREGDSPDRRAPGAHSGAPGNAGDGQAIEDTVLAPVGVVQSLSDPGVRLYYRFYVGTLVGDKFLCVVVKLDADDAFVLTAYLTDEIKKGTEIWPTSA